MLNYKIYMRSFAPWREFGELSGPRTVQIPLPSLPPVGPPRGYPGFPDIATITFGGAFHGDGRGFSMDTSSSVTARVNAVLEVDMTTSTMRSQKAWCDMSRGPLMGIGPADTGIGKPVTTFSVKNRGQSAGIIIAYGAANPLVKGAPDIDARGEFGLMMGTDVLMIDAEITGDQFPACESFIEDPTGNKLFLGGFAPDNKEQIMRLYGSMNKPQKVWFQSHVVVGVDPAGTFKDVRGGGSGTNSTFPACESLLMDVAGWNARIMSTIPMPADSP